MRGKESCGDDSRRTRRKIEQAAKASGTKEAGGQTRSANYSQENNQVNYTSHPVQQLEELRFARESAIAAIHERIRQAEIYGQDTAELDDLLGQITLL